MSKHNHQQTIQLQIRVKQLLLFLALERSRNEWQCLYSLKSFICLWDGSLDQQTYCRLLKVFEEAVDNDRGNLSVFFPPNVVRSECVQVEHCVLVDLHEHSAYRDFVLLGNVNPRFAGLDSSVSTLFRTFWSLFVLSITTDFPASIDSLVIFMHFAFVLYVSYTMRGLECEVLHWYQRNLWKRFLSEWICLKLVSPPVRSFPHLQLSSGSPPALFHLYPRYLVDHGHTLRRFEECLGIEGRKILHDINIERGLVSFEEHLWNLEGEAQIHGHQQIAIRKILWFSCEMIGGNTITYLFDRRHHRHTCNSPLWAYCRSNAHSHSWTFPSMACGSSHCMEQYTPTCERGSQ